MERRWERRQAALLRILIFPQSPSNPSGLNLNYYLGGFRQLEGRGLLFRLVQVTGIGQEIPCEPFPASTFYEPRRAE